MSQSEAMSQCKASFPPRATPLAKSIYHGCHLLKNEKNLKIFNTYMSKVRSTHWGYCLIYWKKEEKALMA